MALMSKSIEAPSLQLARKLARNYEKMGPRLAQLEFREMQKELQSPDLFDLNIDFPEPALTYQPGLLNVLASPEAKRLPKLNVPLGKISWTKNPEDLPVFGIYCKDEKTPDFRLAITELFKSHHAEPFARLLFVCATYRPIPFFGRFGFAYEFVGEASPDAFSPRLALRYGMKELRNIKDGKVLYPRAS